MKIWTAPGAVALAVVTSLAGPGRADDAVLTIDLGSGPQRYTAAALLARPDATRVTVPKDVSYGHAMSYSAVPLLSLLDLPPEAPFDTLQASATDGFVSQIPLSLVRGGSQSGSRAWIAAQDPARPWPDLPGRDTSAGPFYLIWEHPERSSIGSEQWPSALASLSGVMAPAQRWPQMAVGEDSPANAPARRGQEVFTAQCLPCHRIKGAGAGEMGPDLGEANPTQYSTPEALRLLIRNPKSVYGPNQQMPGFDRTMMSDPDLDAVIAYLSYMAGNTSKSAK